MRIGMNPRTAPCAQLPQALKVTLWATICTTQTQGHRAQPPFEEAYQHVAIKHADSSPRTNACSCRKTNAPKRLPPPVSGSALARIRSIIWAWNCGASGGFVYAILDCQFQLASVREMVREMRGVTLTSVKAEATRPCPGWSGRTVPRPGTMAAVPAGH